MPAPHIIRITSRSTCSPSWCWVRCLALLLLLRGEAILMCFAYPAWTVLTRSILLHRISYRRYIDCVSCMSTLKYRWCTVHGISYISCTQYLCHTAHARPAVTVGAKRSYACVLFAGGELFSVLTRKEYLVRCWSPPLGIAQHTCLSTHVSAHLDTIHFLCACLSTASAHVAVPCPFHVSQYNPQQLSLHMPSTHLSPFLTKPRCTLA